MVAAHQAHARPAEAVGGAGAAQAGFPVPEGHALGGRGAALGLAHGLQVWRRIPAGQGRILGGDALGIVGQLLGRQRRAGEVEVVHPVLGDVGAGGVGVRRPHDQDRRAGRQPLQPADLGAHQLLVGDRVERLARALVGAVGQEDQARIIFLELDLQGRVVAGGEVEELRADHPEVRDADPGAPAPGPEGQQRDRRAFGGDAEALFGVGQGDGGAARAGRTIGQGEPIDAVARHDHEVARARLDDGAKPDPVEQGLGIGAQADLGPGLLGDQPPAAEAEHRMLAGRHREAGLHAPAVRLGHVHLAGAVELEGHARRHGSAPRLAEFRLQPRSDGRGDEVAGGVAVADLQDLHRGRAPAVLQIVQGLEEGFQRLRADKFGRARTGERGGGRRHERGRQRQQGRACHCPDACPWASPASG